jgi:hypothetical protein
MEPKDELPTDLRRLVEEVREAATAVASAEAEHTYRLAALARAATGRRVANGSALEVCSAALAVARRTLQSFAMIATRWTHQEIGSLLRDCQTGRPRLTASHLLLLAPLPRPTRERLLTLVLEQELDVRGLRKEILSARTVSRGAAHASGERFANRPSSLVVAVDTVEPKR